MHSMQLCIPPAIKFIVTAAISCHAYMTNHQSKQIGLQKDVIVAKQGGKTGRDKQLVLIIAGGLSECSLYSTGGRPSSLSTRGEAGSSVVPAI